MSYSNQFVLITTLWILIIGLCSRVELKAQQFGGNPAHIKWQQINSENVRVIFPKGAESRASRIASMIEHITMNNAVTVGPKSKRLDLVLQTNQVISNGYVGIAPYRSEFYGTDIQNFNEIGSVDWLDGLTIHEYRHALQFANAKQGLTQFLSLIGGQSGWALASFLSIPDWYFEGDAVLSETLLTNGGRGRLPSFFKEQRANLLSGKQYSYMTARNGSFVKQLPNQYPLGFAICNYTRNEYGASVWPQILADAGRYKPLLYPFSGAMKKYTGKSTEEMYEAAYSDLEQKWEKEVSNLVLTPTEAVIDQDNETVTNYRFAQKLADGSLVAIKGSYKEINHLVLIKDGMEKKLTDYSIVPGLFLSENNGRLAWTEFQRDPRRQHLNYTKLVTYDVKTEERRIIAEKSKYFSPQLSETGSQIVVVRADEHLQNDILILDTETGEVRKTLPNPQNAFYSFPKWTEGDEAIVFLSKLNSRVALFKWQLDNDKVSMLTDWSSHVIGAMDVGKESVYFSSSYSGIDNIYTVSLDGDKDIKQLTSVQIGAYEPTISADEKTLTFGEFTAMGYTLSSIELPNAESLSTFRIVEPANQTRFEIQTTEQEQPILESIEEADYQIENYSGLFRGLKLHSWGFTSPSQSLNLIFENTLSEWEAQFGGIYNSNEETINLYAGISYGKWFPQLGLRAGTLNRSPDYVTSEGFLREEEFDEVYVDAEVSIPLNWNQGNYFYSLQPEVSYRHHFTSDHVRPQYELGDLSFGSLRPSIEFSVLENRARQNLYSRLGVSFGADFQSSLDSDIDAEKISLRGTVFLPGFFKNHSFRAIVGWQKEELSNEYLFPDLFRYSRGYERLPSDEAYRLSLNYALPLLYPDWGFGGLIYFNRVRANGFYDLGASEIGSTTYDQRSYGGELIFDMTLFNALPFTLGLRQSFLVDLDPLNRDRNSYFNVFFSF